MGSFICLDVANGYSEHFVQYVRKVRSTFPTQTIIAGNVVTGEMVEELILSGADIIKVGIGPGSVCTTRKKTGVGYPQLSAVLECADAAHGLGGHIISDGGCTCPGDVAKAFGAGADFVMMGGMLGGIRSACTYTGAGKLKEMPKRTTFIRVSQQLNEIFSGAEASSPPIQANNGSNKRKHSETESSNGKH